MPSPISVRTAPPLLFRRLAAPLLAFFLVTLAASQAAPTPVAHADASAAGHHRVVARGLAGTIVSPECAVTVGQR